MKAFFALPFVFVATQTCTQTSDPTAAAGDSSASPCSSHELGDGRSPSVEIPKDAWPKFIATLRSELRRNVPEVSGEQILGVRYFGYPVPSAKQVGLSKGDMLVAINGREFVREGARAWEILGPEMDRSAQTCELSFTLEENGARRELRARCSS